MVNTFDFGKRIQEIMKFYQLSASGFADAMGVGRSSISHLLSGRNKPSLDFVMKITEAYPEAALHWLLYGKGNFPKSDKINEATNTISHTTPITPTPIEVPKDITPEQNLFTPSKPDTITPSIDITNADEIKKQTKDATDNPKEINQIVCFYTDGTFDVYKN